MLSWGQRNGLKLALPCARAVGNGGREDDEPEVAVLLVACAIGLATGAGVVLFNDVIHGIRHIAWQASTPPAAQLHYTLCCITDTLQIMT